MKPSVLRAHIRPLPQDTPRHKELEHALRVGVGYSGAWYGSQKEHWLGWLAEYSGPGAYARTVGKSRDAAYVYNHIQCAPMLFWLSEALGAPDAQLESAFQAVVDAVPRGAPQCAALRRVLPWHRVETLISCYRYSPMHKMRIKAAAFLP